MKSLSLLLCLALLSACAATPQSKLILANPPESLPLAVELSHTPFYPQTQYQCGPAALATVLQFHGVQVAPDELAKQIYIPDRHGSLQIEITATARSYAMLPYPLEPQLLDLLTEIAAGNPVLVLQNLSFSWYPQWHYAVVVGYDLQRREITLRSGTTKRWTTPLKVFERTWQRADSWALVLVPLGDIPKTATPAHYLETAYAFEALGLLEQASTAYQAAAQYWPDLAAPWLTLGNLAFTQRDWPAAISAFSKATKTEPESLASWNNLAYALDAYGCDLQAQMALQCGLKMAPDDRNLQDSWQDLMLSPVSNDQAECPAIQCEQKITSRSQDAE